MSQHKKKTLLFLLSVSKLWKMLFKKIILGQCFVYIYESLFTYRVDLSFYCGKHSDFPNQLSKSIFVSET